MAVRQTKLYTIFIQYLLALFTGFILLIGVLVIVFEFSIKFGIIIPANYTETLIEQSRTNIENAPKITKEIIPQGCDYAIFDKTGEFLSGNISIENANKAWQLVINNNDTGWGKHYALIEGKNEICIFQYNLLPQFSSAFLRNYLPNPQGFIIIIIMPIMLILEVIFLSIYFGRRINKKLTSLKNAAMKIQEKDLDFSIEYSGIKEIDDILNSLENMKNDLKDSLKQQWDIEQTKKMQISALAHDIKTPLTIIKGNSELLEDSELKDEEMDYVHFIKKNAKQIDEYIKTLIEISNSDKALTVQIDKVNLREFVANIYNQLIALASPKKLNVEFIEHNLPEKVNIDSKLLYRAIMNVISNAVDYCPNGGKILFEVKAIENKIIYIIADSGKGFSKEDIKSATKQFYMGDASRTSKAHYGMGLYITLNIVNLHDGKLHIANSEAIGGGEVTIEIASGSTT